MKSKKYIVLAAAMGLSAMLLTGCGQKQESVKALSVTASGNYKIPASDDALYYVVEFYKSEDIVDGEIAEGAKKVLKQTVKAEDWKGTFKKVSSLAFGSYTPVAKGITAEKQYGTQFVGESFTIGGTLSTPEIVVQRDGAAIKVNIADASFDNNYFAKEKVTDFTAEVYDNKDCSGDPVATANFGEDAAYIDPTNSSKAVWIRNRSAELEVENGTYYVRCKANGDAEAEIKDSSYSAVTEVTIDGESTDVKWCTGTFDPKTGVLTMDETNMLEFGNGAAMFTQFQITDAEDTALEGDLYSFDGDARCDMHLLGAEGDTEGECYTNGPRMMPIDKPDIRGTWSTNEDGTISVKLMADYQYYTDEANKKTT